MNFFRKTSFYEARLEALLNKEGDLTSSEMEELKQCSALLKSRYENSSVKKSELIKALGLVTVGITTLVGKIYVTNKITAYEDNDELITSEARREL
jgi:hypothetical protein